MTWFRIDDGWWVHPKTQRASAAASGLWVRMGAYSSQRLTDGFVPAEALRLVLNEPQDVADRLVAELVSVGFLERTDNGWFIHDFLDYNPSAETVRRQREERSNAGRRGGEISGQMRRDKSLKRHLEAPLQATASESKPLLEAIGNPRPVPSRPVPARPFPSRPDVPSGRTTVAPASSAGPATDASPENEPAAEGAGEDRPDDNGHGRAIRIKTIGSSTPKAGLDGPDLVRRGFSRLYLSKFNAEYPGNGAKDRKAASMLLAYHRRVKIAEPWRGWVAKVVTAYFDIDDDFLARDGYPLCRLSAKLPGIVTRLAAGGAAETCGGDLV